MLAALLIPLLACPPTSIPTRDHQGGHVLAGPYGVPLEIGCRFLAYERAISQAEGCAAIVPALREDGERMLELRLEWPASPGTEFWTDPADAPPNMQSTAAFFHLRRGLGETSSRALGTIEVETASTSTVVVSLELGTANEPDAVTGLLRGSLRFTVCP